MSTKTHIIFIASYLALVAIVLILLGQMGLVEFQASSLLAWDAEHYLSISQTGYKGFLVAFFPLFPLLWSGLHVGPLGISIFNGLLFLMSFLALIRQFKIRDPREMLLYLSIPSSIFFFLPYTESLFFLSTTAIFVGLKKEQMMLVCSGLLMAVLTRPAFAILLPALIIAELFSGYRSITIRNVAAYLMVTAMGVIGVAYIQFLDTGNWFEFFTVQSGWGNELGIPSFPLSSWSDGIVVRLDAMAFLFGIVAGCLLVVYMIKRSVFMNTRLTKAQLFALAYLGGITLSILLFRGGSLFSLNRFVFATPFVIVAFHFWKKQNITLTNRHLALVFVLVSCFWLLFGSYVHIQQILIYTALTGYVLLMFGLKSQFNLLRKYSLYVLIVLNMIFQIVLFTRFLSGQWVG